MLLLYKGRISFPVLDLAGRMLGEVGKEKRRKLIVLFISQWEQIRWVPIAS